MQVFISDLHLTDGTSGQTINSGAVRLFRDNLQKLVLDIKSGKQPVREVKLVLLGDIFDVIRSCKWLETNVRPWSSAGPLQEAAVRGIAEGIFSQNTESISYLKELKSFVNGLGIPFELTYVVGNHDWILNRYPDVVKLTASTLDIAPPPAKFPTEIYEPAYGTIARHGDIYDELNYMGNRDKSSIGDAIVIELLNRFPEEVSHRLRGVLRADERQAVTDKLKELDNVRPLLDIPAWVLMLTREIRDSTLQRIVEKAWQKCVEDFFNVPFIKDMDIPFWPDTIDRLQAALNLSSRTSMRVLDKIVDIKNRLLPAGIEKGLQRSAWAETRIQSGEAKYVVYGHTHDHVIIPMDQFQQTNGEIQNKIYFNAGTWRQTWNRAAFDTSRREFVGWKVLTYIAFYQAEENNEYSFEVWNGSLGYDHLGKTLA